MPSRGKRSIHIDLVGLDDIEAAKIANAISVVLHAMAPGDASELTSDITVAALRETNLFGKKTGWKKMPMACTKTP